MTQFSIFTLVTRELNTVAKNKEHFDSLQIPFSVIDNKNKSVAYGREKGYSETDSKYVSFVDDDDISLLAPEHLDIILPEYIRPVYTNSYKVYSHGKELLTDERIKHWSFDNEKTKKTKPHQTMILKKDDSICYLRMTKELLAYKGWPDNVFDYVFRVLISLESGWTYYPFVTYEWIIGHDNLHTKDRMLHYVVSNYFFRYVNMINMPSYENEKNVVYKGNMRC
jgi:glycosyltransferase involved in cell wall biosynthesis